MSAEAERDGLSLEALQWFVAMQDEATAAPRRRAFATWIADPEHAAAYARAEALWARFEMVRPEYERMRRAGRIGQGGGIGRREALLGGLAATVGLSLGWRWARQSDYSAGIGQGRSLVLADGSRVELGPDAGISVELTPEARRIRLDRGQVWFQVAPDAARPFAVEAGAGRVVALGTAFDVNLRAGQVVVTVTEHAVSVSAGEAAPVTLGQGWQMSYGARGLVPGRPVDTQAATGWRQGRLVFDEVPLREVLAELQRYRRGRILLLDDAVGALPVTAIFDASDADAALSHIARILPIRVREAAGLVVLVDRRAPEGAAG
ncbi:FecR family protein [Paracoccus aminovorans]|uniref:FecR family protein n=1 Tax=Paracoccus aminovorans TaxID=34004 RepID=UPI002B25FBDC|nr:FecR domain-containing protein [Paracoccus aminovorans]